MESTFIAHRDRLNLPAHDVMYRIGPMKLPDIHFKRVFTQHMLSRLGTSWHEESSPKVQKVASPYTATVSEGEYNYS